ncbi:MAG TPA: hypothetical protein VFA37_05315 [Gaiellaceae bacterium]|nr:hypothetical protein [Gaiellaceae bacterium]
MASTTSSPAGFLASPRNQRRLMWVSAAVLVLGVAALLAVVLSRGSGQPASVSTINTPKPTDTTPAQNVKVAPAASALQVARTFIETAVVRKNLDTAYALAGPFLKNGISLKQWRTGNIPVQPYPAMNASTATLRVTSSTKSEILLQVVLNPRAGSGVKAPQAFDMRLDHIRGKWLVNNFIVEYKLPVQPGPQLGN